MMRTLAIALAQTLIFASAAFAQEPLPAYRARLLGVYDERTGDAIEGAEVIDVLEKTTALTTKTGTVTLAFLPDGGGMIRIRKIGYNTATMVVAISPADTVPLTILLSPTATQLEKVVTTDSAPRHIAPGLTAFEERRKQNVGGSFIAAAELRKSDARPLANVLRNIPGLKVACSATLNECRALSGRSQSQDALHGGQWGVALYRDGAAQTDPDLNKLRVDQLGGVEYYAGAAVPIQYNRTGSTCGVLLLWSRER